MFREHLDQKTEGPSLFDRLDADTVNWIVNYADWTQVSVRSRDQLSTNHSSPGQHLLHLHLLLLWYSGHSQGCHGASLGPNVSTGVGGRKECPQLNIHTTKSLERYYVT